MRNGHKLEIEGLSKSFPSRAGWFEVLRDVTLEIDEGELICVLGESGCGKTTLLKIIAGLETLTKGRVTLNGEPVDGPNALRGLVFQDPSLLPWLSVRRNVSLGLDIRRDNTDKNDRIDEVIRLVGLQGFEEYRPRKLSGGMAHRVALARAIVNRPSVLLLDEPFGSLDPVTRNRMQEELLRIWEEQRLTAVFVTHDIDEAILLGNRIVVLASRPGRIRKIIDVPLTRPRVRTSREFFAFRAKISSFFFSSVGQAEGRGEQRLVSDLARA